MRSNNSVFILSNFYSRRIKRLFPALFIFFSITTIFVVSIFIRSDIKNFLNSLIAAKTFWSNIYFWRDGGSGYFGVNNQIKPLLHTWSLSIEEQFYLFYPIFILFCFWLNSKIKISIRFLIFLLTILSFIFWFYLGKHDAANPSFFLFPARIWQFGLGGLLSIFLFSESSLKIDIFFKKIFLLFSILILFLGLFLSIETYIQRIFVSIGAVFFIAASSNFSKNILLSFFRSKIAVFLGKISYSVYLYHWIIAVFMNYYYVETLPLWASLFGVFLSFLTGFLSFKYIETPFRKKLDLKYTFALIFFCSIFNLSIITSSLIVTSKQKDISDEWSSSSAKNYRCPIESYYKFGSSRACILANETSSKDVVAVMGNSHAQMYGPLFVESGKKIDIKIILIPLNACLPTITVNISNACLNAAKINLNTVLSDTNIKKIFLAMTWDNETYVNSNGLNVSKDAFIVSLNDLIDKIVLSGKEVFLFSPIATPKKDLANTLPRLIKFSHISVNQALEQLSIPRDSFDEQFNSINLELKNHLGDHYIEVWRDLCDEKKCYFAKANKMFFSDSSHLAENTLMELKLTYKKVLYILSPSL
jgi:peptidoglycan/LPS O-acetylase OafA/YrhL